MKRDLLQTPTPEKRIPRVRGTHFVCFFFLLPSPGVDHHPPLETLQETGGLLALQDLDLPIETHDRVISHVSRFCTHKNNTCLCRKSEQYWEGQIKARDNTMFMENTMTVLSTAFLWSMTLGLSWPITHYSLIPCLALKSKQKNSDFKWHFIWNTLYFYSS